MGADVLKATRTPAFTRHVFKRGTSGLLPDSILRGPQFRGE